MCIRDSINRVFAENFVGLGLLQSVSYIKTNPNPRKISCCGKKWPKCHFKPNCSGVGFGLGLGSSTVFIVIFVSQLNRIWYIANTQISQAQGRQSTAVVVVMIIERESSTIDKRKMRYLVDTSYEAGIRYHFTEDVVQ